MDTNAPKDKKVNGFLQVALISLFALLIVSCNAISVLSYFIFSGLTSSELNETSLIEEFLSFEEQRTYIDPEIDSESQYLLERAVDTFDLTYQIEGDPTYIKDLEPFILSNLEQNYEELVVKFENEISEKIDLTITDNQDWYEIELGFDYNDDLPYAGLSTYRKIVLLISEDIESDKNEFNNILKHELVHVYQFENFGNELVTYPNWFLEGTAEYFSDTKQVPLYYYEEVNLFNNLDRLSDTFSSGKLYETSAAYLVSHKFIEFIATRYGEDKVIQIMINDKYYLNDDDKIASFEEIFEMFFDQDCNTMYEQWYYREIYDDDLSSQANLMHYNGQKVAMIVYNNEFFI